MAAPIVFMNAKIFFHGYDLSADLNEVALEYQSESLDQTAFGDTTRTRKGGLKAARATGRGFWRAGANVVDPALFTEVGEDDRVLTLFPVAPIEGSTSTGSGYAFKVALMTYTLGGPAGALLPFDFVAEGRGVQG